MNKKEADIIIKACKKNAIEAGIHKSVDQYAIVLSNRFSFRNFEAAKLMVNALYLENKEKQSRKKQAYNTGDTDISKLDFSRYFKPKDRQGESISWAERKKDT